VTATDGFTKLAAAETNYGAGFIQPHSNRNQTTRFALADLIGGAEAYFIYATFLLAGLELA
jgi:hypothetical protein